MPGSINEFTNVLENVVILRDGLDPDPYRELDLRRTLRFIKTIAELSKLTTLLAREHESVTIWP